MKKFLFICLVFISLQAQAFVPPSLAVYGLPSSTYTGAFAGAGGAGSVAGGTSFFLGAGAFALGMSIGYFGLDYALGDDNSTGSVRIPLTANPANAIPPPQASSTATGVSTYIGQYSGSTFYDSACGAVHGEVGSGASVCTKTACVIGRVEAANNGVTYTSSVGTFSAPSTCSISYQLNWSGSDHPFSTSRTLQASGSTCPNGYVSSGATCILQDARAAAPDHACDVARSGSALAMISDPDCAHSGQAIPAICASQGITCLGVGAYQGNPASYSITTTPDGGSIVRTYTQKTVGGQTQVTDTHFTIDPVGTLTGISGGVKAGTIDPVTGTPVTTTDPVVSAPIQFPTDYARQGEAVQAAAPITQAITAQTAADKVYRDAQDIKDANDRIVPDTPLIPKETINFTFTPSVFASSAVCPAPIDFSMMGTAYAISYTPMCDLMSLLRPLFLAFGAISASMIFVGGLKA